METEMIVALEIPQDIVNEILDHLNTGSRFHHSLLSYSLVAKSWVIPCRRHLFGTIAFTGRKMDRWLKAFPVPEESPAPYVRDLSLSLEERYYVPYEFFKRIQLFSNVRKLTMSREGGNQSWWVNPLVGLPQSVTSLTINEDSITVLRIRDILLQLPNLNDLSLSGPILTVDRNLLRGIGKTLKANFGGRLQLCNLGGRPATDVVNMLLDVPTGLRFTEMSIDNWTESLVSAVKLAEACSITLVRLSYWADGQGNSHLSPLSRYALHVKR